ncbi:uncharacterized protein MELLADRAFT_92376 [Melampsora larici-populina 98AG31]|uniref:NADH dehydrogenase [ubiquinone] 1 beta subcomplex subunit 11, mitochondrial n=1 Tax=Melampsora larici-populina (strain 98AG31 / pathotype 3-4-7) TaxID=747676 RepID=F4R9E4_MELLP|nr:uncharacterized protein MELLADRAFT_92376 [Melampsora larici-populina 98AG31]EGG11169.1 hypothetical protein MELLADRAFT_92376 [Melampsora larici-populina 98AG31]
MCESQPDACKHLCLLLEATGAHALIMRARPAQGPARRTIQISFSVQIASEIPHTPLQVSLNINIIKVKTIKPTKMITSILSKPLRRSARLDSLTHSTRSASGSPHYNQPSGWLFGEKPLKPGEKRVREDWELTWYIGFWGTTALGILMHIYKPDRSITTWARQEAEKRSEAPTYEKS